MTKTNTTDEKKNEKAQLIEPEKTNKVPAVGRRHVVLLFSFLGMFISKAMRINLSVAVVAMVNNTQLPESPNNISFSQLQCPERTSSSFTNNMEGEFNWSATTVGLVLSSFFYGYFLTQVLGGQLSEYYGGRPMLALGVGITAVLTILTPVLTRTHVALLIAARVIKGMACGFIIPATSVLISKWAPMSEKSRFGATKWAGGNIGAVFGTVVTGFLSNMRIAGGWPSSFYLFGVMGLLWVLALLLFTAENPEQDKNISASERKYILQTTGSREKREKTPWRCLLTSGPVWAMVVGHTCRNFAYFALLTTLPTYLKDVLRFNISENGLLSALPYLCITGVEIFGSFVADYLLAKEVFSILNIRRIFSALGVFPACVCILGLGFVDCHQVAAVLLLCLSTGILGFSSSGFLISHYDIAPRHAGTVFGISNTFASISPFLGPSVVMAITDNKPYFTRWRWVFILTSAVYAVGGAICLIFTQAEEQPWAKGEEEEEEETDCQKEKPLT